MNDQPTVDGNSIPPRKFCPCGCGRYLPEPVRTIHMGPAGTAIEGWLKEQGLSLEDARRKDNHPDMVETRRRVAKFLSEHGWSHERIGTFIERDRGSVRNLLGRKNR